MSVATSFCAALIAHRYLSRSSKLAAEVLLDDSKLADVQRQLALCGLRLVDSAFSGFVGVALVERDGDGDNITDAVFGEDDPKPFTTFGLQRDELGLAMLLWMLLCFPKRQPESSDGESDQRNPRILVSQLLNDFPGVGKPQTIKGNLTRLKSLEIVNYDSEGYLIEGPLLELMFDGMAITTRIADQSFRETLDRLRSRRKDAEEIQADLLDTGANASEREEESP